MNGNPFDDMASGGRFKDRLRDRVGRAVVRNQRGGERLRVRLGMMFRARGRLWLGMPAAAVVAFLLCFPLRMIDSPATEALTRGGIAAGVVALCWAIGIWASTGGPHSGEQAGRTGSEETDDADDLLSRWIDRLRQRAPWQAGCSVWCSCSRRWPRSAHRNWSCSFLGPGRRYAPSRASCSRSSPSGPSCFPYGWLRAADSPAVFGRSHKGVPGDAFFVTSGRPPACGLRKSRYLCLTKKCFRT